jgi:hypothetical protein
MKTTKTNTKSTVKVYKAKEIHEGCGGKVKPTLGRGRQYGSCVCTACGMFFN